MEQRTLVLGTRASRLAFAQAETVARALIRALPGLEVKVRTISTEGDRVQSTAPGSLPSWGQGVFARDIERALLGGEIDFAVHSLKDLPATLPDGLAIAAVPERADPADLLVTRDGRSLEEMPLGARVGTSSLRRAAFLLACRPDLTIVPVRGNVDTRWRKLLDRQQGFDALVLAAAGLERIDLNQAESWTIPTEIMPPAPGQGALALEARAADDPTRFALATLNHFPTEAAVTAERRVLRDLEGGCRVPMAALGTPLLDGALALSAAVAAPDGSRIVRDAVQGRQCEAEALGAALAIRLTEAGAGELLRQAEASGAGTVQALP